MSAATIAAMQRQAQQAEVERLALEKERDELRAALRGIYPYAESRVEDMLEELEAIESGEKQVAQPLTECQANVAKAVFAMERAEEILGGGQVVTLTPAGEAAARAIAEERGGR